MLERSRMGESFILCQVLVYFFLAGQSHAVHSMWNGYTYREENAYPYYSGMATGEGARQSLKQKFLGALFSRLLQNKAAANAEQDLVEEEADRLTSITRYVGVGYNLLKGSPEGDFDHGGADPGILINRGVIFEFTYNDGNEAIFLGEKVQVPDQVKFHPRTTCATKSGENIFSGAKSYQNSLNIGISPSATIFGFQFGLSGAMKRAKEKTAGRKRVSQDEKQICNYGHVTYLTGAQGIHTVSKLFYDRVKTLPMKYEVEDYMQFIRDYGTHVIVQADIGVKNIVRSYYTYSEVYQQLKTQRSGGITIGGNVNGFGGSLGLDIGKMKGKGKNRMKSNLNSETISIGTVYNPSPICLDLWNISEVLRHEYWTALPEAGVTYESLGISQRKKNLERALADYADYEGVDELKDPTIQIKMKWPNGKYALPAPEGDCPKGWSRGSRTQGTGGNTSVSRGITSRLGVKYGGKTITIEYCVKRDVSGDGVGFEWPKGSYCIAQREGCPEDSFEEGSISWNDYKSQFLRKSLNDKWGILPDGEYDKNTVIFFCCRNDNPATSPMMLPIAEPFILYRYGRKCQAVEGTTLQNDFIKYDDSSRVRSKNRCTGAHPDDDDCDREHKIHFCYYGRKKLP